MNKYFLILTITSSLCFNFCFLKAQQPLDYVNMMIGTSGPHKTEYGGTTPAVSTPFGMTQWCAATRINGISKTMYHYEDTTLIGFMATHQPAIWMGDYGYLTLMPQVQNLKISPLERAVKLNRKEEVAKPNYYKIKFKDNNFNEIQTEFTATSRCSFFCITYPKDSKPLLFLQYGRGKEGGGVEIDSVKQEIRIYNSERQDAHLGPPLYNFRGYYVLKFQQGFSKIGTWNEEGLKMGQSIASSSVGGAFVEFPHGTKIVEIKIGSSFISYEQAKINIEKEIPAQIPFSEIIKRNADSWNKYLSKIQIKDATDEDLHIFYTAFFRTLQYPREFSEYGKYYSPFDDKVHNGMSYNAYSLWDTFRAQHPWLLLMAPDRVDDMITSLVNMYKEGGWLPKWPNPSYTNIMIGTHADAVIADAYINGYENYDVKSAYKAIRKDAFTPPENDTLYKWGDRDFWNGSYEARAGLTNYISKGYVASDITNESVARTLEYALDDYCVAQMAYQLGHIDDYNVLRRRSENYKNLYNPITGIFQARNEDGNWENTKGGYTEGDFWTYRFCVMQDAPGLINLMNGKDIFLSKLDSVFDTKHYRHDNEPCHHYVYLYNYCNRLDKTQLRIPYILEENYRNKPDGLSGNDDCGQMSAWYLFSSLGLYPFKPASGEYAIGMPHFKEVILKLPNEKKLTIVAHSQGKVKQFSKVKFNGQLLSTPFIKTSEIRKGGILEFIP